MTDLILGIEIGGTKQQVAIGTPEGQILTLRQVRVDLASGGAGIRKWLHEQISELIGTAEAENRKISAIGVGFGGPIDTARGQVLQSIQVSGWQDFPIKSWFQEQFNLPTIVANDSNAATWGEYRCGFGRGSDHFFYTNIGSGIGGGFVFDGKLFDGQGFGAGEFGHTFVPDWANISQGMRGSQIENLCSGWAIESRLRTPGYIPGSSALYRSNPDDLVKITTKDLGEAARSGDPFSMAEIDRVAHSIGIGLANVLSLTGVERIAIGGGVSNLGTLLMDPIRRYTEKYAFISSKGRYQIERCSLGDQIVLVGALLLASECVGAP